MFHEFTHILDTEMYAQKDKMKNVMHKGFLEYHAGQIDFLKILEVKKADKNTYDFSLIGRPAPHSHYHSFLYVA